MFNDTHETARTQFIPVRDVQFAYRRYGRRGAVPLLLLNLLCRESSHVNLKFAA